MKHACAWEGGGGQTSNLLLNKKTITDCWILNFNEILGLSA